MHLSAVGTLLLHYHDNKAVQDVLRRLDKDMLIGTEVYSDPATGKVRGKGMIWKSRINQSLFDD